jgi:hypothetical protein
MNFPSNLLFDLEMAKRRLREALEPASESVSEPDPNDCRESQIDRTLPSSPSSTVTDASSFALPNIDGRAATCF